MSEIIGLLAAVCTSFAFFPQVFKVLRTRSLKDVSLLTLLQLSLGVSLWIAYGLLRNDSIIIAANAVTLLSLVILVFLYVRFWQKSEQSSLR
jgi:MtN3 and saliva related transmembrane protein